MGKFKMPTVKQFLKKKIIYDTKKDPVWVYLEKEMLANIENKPYNEKVGKWLRFLKELRYYFYCEDYASIPTSNVSNEPICAQLTAAYIQSAIDNLPRETSVKNTKNASMLCYKSLKHFISKRKERRLKREVGPSWYCELSSCQIEVLKNLKSNMHQDLLEDLPIRIRHSLSDLGITLRIPKNLLMKAMNESCSDPGVFVWNLYTAYYKKPPSELRPEYDINAMILMSCLVFIDLEECVDRLEKLTYTEKVPPDDKPKKKTKYFEPDIRYGEYLQKMYVPLYSGHPSTTKKKHKIPPIGYKFRLRNESSYERLCKDHSFLEKRKERNKKQKQAERICTYKFWEPPSTLRNTDPSMVAMVEKLKMLKKKAKAKHKSPYKNVQYLVSGVSYSGETPNYILANVSLLPTGYIPIHGGVVELRGNFITVINGYWKFPKEVREKCDHTCDCLAEWESTAMEYIQKSKCKCGHLYDFHNEGKAVEKYFHQATRHGTCWMDTAKVYQMDPKEDFIKDTIRDALMSRDPTPEPSMPTISATGMKEKDLLAALLADLSDTPLLIPHLPKANLLNNLQEWVRKRVKGKIMDKQHKQFILTSQRRWVDLKHIDFRARAYRIPFTLKQLEHFNWSHRKLVQTLFKILLDNFVSRNRQMQLEQTRLWWSTMKYDSYPGKPFLDIYFTYMPGRMKDTFLINPYSSELTPKYGAKTCPL